MADQTLKFIIEAVTKGFDGLKNLMTPLNDGLTQAKAQIQSADSAFKSAFQASGTEGAMSGITASLGSFMVSIGAAAAAYEAFRALLSAPLKGFEFNKDMETGRLGIASIITATTELISQDGRRLSGMEKLNEAQKVAADLMKQLQIAGLETTATTQQLVEAFQGYIAPATAAGLTMKQTKEYTLMMVQALGAMGMPMNQLAQEGRSILEGAITPINSRLATALGISNDMVAQWKAGGTLWQELTKRLEAFKLSGQAIANTWTGMSSNMKDAISYLTGKMTEGMFESIKSSWLSLLNTLVSTKGDIGVGEDIKNIFAGAKTIADDIGKLLVSGMQGFIGILKEANVYIGQHKKEFEEVYAIVKNIISLLAEVAAQGLAFVGFIAKAAVESGTLHGVLKLINVALAAALDFVDYLKLAFLSVALVVAETLHPVLMLTDAIHFTVGAQQNMIALAVKIGNEWEKTAISLARNPTHLSNALGLQDKITQSATKGAEIQNKATSSVESMAQSYDVIKQKLELQNKKLSEGLTLLDEQSKKRTLEIEVKYSGTAGGVDRDNKIYADTLKVRQDYYKQLSQFAKDYDKKQDLIFADETKKLNLAAEAQLNTMKNLDVEKRKILDQNLFTNDDLNKVNATDSTIAKERAKYEEIAILQSKILQLKIKTAQEAQTAVGKALDQSMQNEKKYADEVTKLNQDIKSAKISLNSELAALDRTRMSDDQKAVNEYRTGIQLRGQAFLEMIQGNYDTAKQLASESKSLIIEAAKSGYVDFRQAREQYRLSGEIYIQILEKQKAEAQKRWEAEQQNVKNLEAAMKQLDASVQESAKAFNALTKDTTTKIIFNPVGLDEIEERIKKLDGKVINLTIKQTTIEGKATGGLVGAWNAVAAFARGGQLPGWGGGDSVKAILEPGEFVVRKEAVSKFGAGLFHALNSLQMPDLSSLSRVRISPPSLPSTARQAFATGGIVTGGAAESGGMMTLNLNIGGTVIKTYTDKGNADVLKQLNKQLERKRKTGYQG